MSENHIAYVIMNYPTDQRTAHILKIFSNLESAEDYKRQLDREKRVTDIYLIESFPIEQNSFVRDLTLEEVDQLEQLEQQERDLNE